MNNQMPFISVIIPCYNEEKYLPALFSNLLEQDYPKDRCEIIFADGRSSDKTREVIESYTRDHQNIRCIDNPSRYVPTALNLAIASSRGEIIIRMDAHSIYPTNYWTTLTRKLIEHQAENVGGVWDTQPGIDSYEARAIVLATTHPLGIGNAGYRLGAGQDIEVDTVPFGCFHRALFERIGYFDTDLLRNQDDEFNGRIRKHGGRIVLIPSLRIKYFARPTLQKVSRMFYQYGLFKPLVNMKLGAPATLRQFAPPLLVLSVSLLVLLQLFIPRLSLVLAMELFVYLLAIGIVSAKLCRGKSLVLLGYTVVAFPVIHFSYGIGYIFGLIKYTVFRSHLKKQPDTVSSSR